MVDEQAKVKQAFSRVLQMSSGDSRPRSRSRSHSRDRDSKNHDDRAYEPEQEPFRAPPSVDNSVDPNSNNNTGNQTLASGPIDPEYNLKCRLFIGSLSFSVCKIIFSYEIF